MGPLPDLGRPIRIATPCCGLDAGDDFYICEIPYEICNCYDIIGRYRATMAKLVESRTGKKPNLHMGKTEGNILNVPLDALDSGHVDLLKGGPPCPPWSKQGNKAGQGDKRAWVFEKVLEWLIYFVAMRKLKAVCLENVLGVLVAWGGKEAFYHKVLRILKTLVPELNWRIDAPPSDLIFLV